MALISAINCAGEKFSTQDAKFGQAAAQAPQPLQANALTSTF
jgi:hypothetical protein